MTTEKEHRNTLSQLIEFYELEEHLYRLLLRVTEVQVEALKAHATPAEFILLADRKESVLRSIERVDRTLKPLKVRYVTETNGSTETDRTRLDQVLDHILDLMNEIAANERASRELLEQMQARPQARRPARGVMSMPGFASAARIRSQVQDLAQ